MAPRHDAKATWTREDWDYVSYCRFREALSPLIIALLIIPAVWCLNHALPATGEPHYAYPLPILLMTLASAHVSRVIPEKFSKWIEHRFPLTLERKLYELKIETPGIQDALNKLEPAGSSLAAVLDARDDMLAPLQSRTSFFRRCLQSFALIEWSFAAIAILFAMSHEAYSADQTLPAALMGAALVATGLGMPPLWQFIIYDLPERMNSLVAQVQLSPAMLTVLEETTDDDGQIWLHEHKVIPRALFKTPFGPLLLGDPWNAAPLPLGLWTKVGDVRQDMSNEIRRCHFLTNVFHHQMNRSSGSDAQHP